MGTTTATLIPQVESVPAILVVDDNAVKRIALRAMLTPLGHEIVEVDSGRAALEALGRHTFALILMDVRMPIMDGFETARLCREQGRGARTPIIFVTAVGGEDSEAANAYASGAVDFIYTPVVSDVLRAKVSAFVDLFLQAQDLQRSLEAITALNAALRDSDVLTQAVLDNVSDGIFILAENGLIESVNKSVGRLFGYEADEPVGHPFGYMIAAESRDGLHEPTAPAGRPAATGPPGRTVETVGCRQDGSTFPIELERRRIEHGRRSFTLVTVRDISDRKAHTEALEHLALHDGLTGLANRTLFGDVMSRSLALARRSGETRAVLVMDLDGFKRINDTLGHDRGDTVLKQVGDRLSETLRQSDTVARLGGDEFAVLPAEAGDIAAASEVAWKIRESFERGFFLSGGTVHIMPSIGIALFPDHGDTPAELMHCADLAMYTAKRSRQGHTVYSVARESETADHLSLLLDLRHCISRDELVLHYQPKIDLASHRVTGVEALIRWDHPEHGLLAPGRFMPEVERTQLIEPLTRWVLDAALRQQSLWHEEGFELTMAINVSARSLSSASGFPDAVAELTNLWGTAPGGLILELTEGALIEAAAPSVLERLHEMGERVSIDDFGTGYSSLAYLQRLPVDEIKIDRSFVTNVATVSDDAIIVRSTIELAHNLGLQVVAEGVEDERAASKLCEYGCDGAQGYLYGRAMPAEGISLQLADEASGVTSSDRMLQAPEARPARLLGAAQPSRRS